MLFFRINKKHKPILIKAETLGVYNKCWKNAACKPNYACQAEIYDSNYDLKLKHNCKEASLCFFIRKIINMLFYRL